MRVSVIARNQISAPDIEAYQRNHSEKQHCDFKTLSERKLFCGGFAILKGLRFLLPSCATSGGTFEHGEGGNQAAWERLSEHAIDRRSSCVCLGGGLVGHRRAAVQKSGLLAK